MRITSEPVRSLYLPLCAGGVLLPVAVVGEIIGYVSPTVWGRPGLPSWLVGTMPWRGRSLPVCTLEVAFGEKHQPPDMRGRVAVLHSIGGDESLSYLGVVLQGIPQVVLASHDTVQWIDPDLPRPPFSLGRISAKGREGWIPDLEDIGRVVSEAMPALDLAH